MINRVTVALFLLGLWLSGCDFQSETARARQRRADYRRCVNTYQGEMRARVIMVAEDCVANTNTPVSVCMERATLFHCGD